MNTTTNKHVNEDTIEIDGETWVRAYGGEIFKSASWKAPAKHARGSIYEPAETSCDSYGAKYLR